VLVPVRTAWLTGFKHLVTSLYREVKSKIAKEGTQREQKFQMTKAEVSNFKGALKKHIILKSLRLV